MLVQDVESSNVEFMLRKEQRILLQIKMQEMEKFAL